VLVVGGGTAMGCHMLEIIFECRKLGMLDKNMIIGHLDPDDDIGFKHTDLFKFKNFTDKSL